MLRKIIQYGRIQVALIAYTPTTETFLSEFLQYLPGKASLSTTVSRLKWVLHIIAADRGWSGILDIPSNKSQCSWSKLYKSYLNLETGRMDSFFAIQMGSGQVETEFIHFMSSMHTKAEESANLLIHLVQVIRRWLMVNGNIPLHASTIVQRGHGLLFLGQSGAGKSTIAMFCQSPARVMHDEKVFLTPRDGHYILSQIPCLDEAAEAADENEMVRNQPDNGQKICLAGIFVLKQDRKDFLVPLPRMNSAKALMASYLELPRIFTFSRQELQYTLKILSQVARDIPAYELHFRKSPDFWKLIDGQFTD